MKAVPERLAAAAGSWRDVTVPNGVRIAYFDTGGPGPAVVFLHGLAGSAPEWADTVAGLPEYRCILVDLRGHGRSTRLPGDLSRDAFVGDVIAVIESAVGAPVCLVGQSMGAHTAMLVAAARPDLVERLVLLESNAGGVTPEAIAEIGAFFRSWPQPFPSREAAADFLGDTALTRAWVADLEQRDDGLWARFDPSVMEEAIADLAEPRWAEWEALTVPTLAVYAPNGMFDQRAKDDFTTRGTNVQRVDLPRGSHDAHLDATDDWVQVLRRHLPQPGG